MDLTAEPEGFACNAPILVLEDKSPRERVRARGCRVAPRSSEESSDDDLVARRSGFALEFAVHLVAMVVGPNGTPNHAGETVIQKFCRPFSNFRTEKGYVIKKCFECRRKCPRTLGIKES